MNQVAKKQTTEVATIEDKANTVAIQLNTDVIAFTATPETVVALQKKYSHLKSISVDCKEDYDSLVKAIADCRDTRTSTSKEKKHWKDPVLAFGKAVEAMAKKVIEPLQEFEELLKLEKQRIDDIKAERKAAIKEAELRAKQIQQDELNDLRGLYVNLSSYNIKMLEAALADISAYELTETNYGDYLEEAEQALVDARIRVNAAIAHAEQAEELRLKQKKLDDEQVASEEKEASRLAGIEALRRKEAHEKKVDDQRIADETAASQKVIDDQAALIKKMEQDVLDAAEAAKPKVEDPKPNIEVVGGEKLIENIQNIPKGGAVNKMSDNEFVNKVTPFYIGTAGNDAEDIAALREFIVVLQEAASKAPNISNNTLSFELARVKTSIGKACEHIETHIAKVEK